MRRIPPRRYKIAAFIGPIAMFREYLAQMRLLLGQNEGGTHIWRWESR